jgi:hypothetical protein
MNVIALESNNGEWKKIFSATFLIDPLIPTFSRREKEQNA